MSRRGCSRPVKELARDTLTVCWSQVGLPSERLDVILDQVWRSATWSEATQRARLELDKVQIHPRTYHVARGRKFDTFARVLQPYVFGSVLDVGAGGPDLLERLSADERVATDILDTDRRALGIRHVVQTMPDALPFRDETFDTVLMTGMAHHLDEEDRNRLLDDVKRCLRPGGQVLLIEETFSRISGCGQSSEPDMSHFSVSFDQLTPEDRYSFLEFTDWWGNRVMKRSDDIPLPMTFLDLERWSMTLANVGLPVTHAELLGMMSGGGHLATPRALIRAARH